MLLVAAMLDNGRKILGTSFVDPSSPESVAGQPTPDPFASLMSITSRTEYVQRDAPEGKSSVDVKYNTKFSWNDFNPSYSSLTNSDQCDIGTFYGPDAHSENEAASNLIRERINLCGNPTGSRTSIVWMKAAVINAAGDAAEARGMPRDRIEAIWDLLVENSIAYEFEIWDATRD